MKRILLGAYLAIATLLIGMSSCDKNDNISDDANDTLDIITLDAVFPEEGGVIFTGVIKNLDEVLNSIGGGFVGGLLGIEYSFSNIFEDSCTVKLTPGFGGFDRTCDTIKCVMKDFDYCKQYFYRTYIKFPETTKVGNVKTFRIEWPTPSIVDLGLSVKWASTNVGANNPWERGDYYAWGEIETYYEDGYADNPNAIWKSGKEEGYTWNSYKYSNGSYRTLTKYNTNDRYGVVDNKTTLDPEDDVAHVKWSGTWRMPTQLECQELVDNCTWTKKTINGIEGYVVKSNVSGYTDNFIFLPWGLRVFGNDIPESPFVPKFMYWSSSLDTEDTSQAIQLNATEWTTRCYAGLIRPVRP